ncbi:hypothetical protein A8B83_15050 [Rhodobacteraceae bacterium EhC02]|nr:hypothetical protein A8B83_15050 [Rhodobacteraceae bacterium EhC02]
MFAIVGSHVLRKDSSRRLTAFSLLALLVLSCLAMVYSAQSFRDRIDAVRASDSDNAGWLISQLDVDHKAVELAIDRVLLSDVYPELLTYENTDLSAVRLRFDIFYSRVDTVLSALGREELPQQLQDLLVVLSMTRDALATEIDGIADNDRDALLRFAERVSAFRPVVRDVTTMSLQYFVAQSERVREMEQSLLHQFWVQSVVLLALMVISAMLALRLWRELEERTVMMQRALDTVSKVVDVSISAIVITDMKGRIQLANPAASLIFGVPSDALVGRQLDDVMIPEGLHAPKGGFSKDAAGQRLIAGTGPMRMDAKRMDGSPFKAEVSVVGDTDLDGRPIIIGFIGDISEMVAAEEKLLEARDEAQRHAAAKSMFLATMSHEMRTPLHGVIASLDLIEDSALDSESRALLQTARDCSDRALQQVNDVLEITRLGESQLGEVPFNPADVAADILRELTPMALARGIGLDLEINGQGQDRVCHGLANAFSRALYNLAGNALKFTDQGRVVISLAFQPVAQDAVCLRVDVTDTGIGIDPADQARIFAEFETVDAVAKGREAGTGLGLAIVRLAVARMGGTLELQSVPGKGSTFSFEITLPLAAEDGDAQQARLPAPQADPQDSEELDPLDVLVVDDNAVNVVLMCKMVQKMGHRVEQARNGLEAVELASSRAFDVILMDVSMPLMDGSEATMLIRASGMSSAAVIIGVTAFSDDDRLRDLKAKGMDDVLTKPVNTAELSQAIGALWDVRLSDDPDSGEDRGTMDPELRTALDQLGDMLDRPSALRYMLQALDELEGVLPKMLDAGLPLEVIADHVHGVAGATSVVGLTRLSGLLAKAETAARCGQREKLTSLHADMTVLLAATRAGLDAADTALSA